MKIMHKYTKLTIAALVVAIFLPVYAYAADAADVFNDPSALGSTWATLITALTPFIVAGIKWVIPKMPTKLIPLIAGVIGLALALGAHYFIGLDVNWWQGVLLGIAGVGLRELYDQLKQKTHTVAENDAITAGSTTSTASPK